MFGLPVYYLIDKVGRRFLLLATYPGMAISLLAACLSFDISATNAARAPVITIFIFVFVLFYSLGQGPVPFSYSSEVFPLLNREAGMSFSVFVNLMFLGLLTLFVPVLTIKLQDGSSSPAEGQSKLLGVFAGLNVLAFLLIFFFVPETAGASLGKQEGSLNYISLEELNYIFGVSTKQHIRYQLRHVVPGGIAATKYWFRRRILRQQKLEEPEEREDLYNWVSVQKLKEDEKERSKREAAACEREIMGEDDGRVSPFDEAVERHSDQS